jgi:hypothetical protein
MLPTVQEYRVIVPNDRMIMNTTNWKGCGSKGAWHDLSYYPVLA